MTRRAPRLLWGLVAAAALAAPAGTAAADPVLVAARSLPPRTVIGEADVRASGDPDLRVPRNAISERELIVGKRTTRSVRAGAVWRENWVAEVPAITRGAMVRLRIERGPLRIDTAGKAREDGLAGERVRVLNLRSRREVMGIVGRDGVVHVVF